MLTGFSRVPRRRANDHRLRRHASSKVFDQLCPNIRRFGRCELHEGQLARAAAVRAARLEKQRLRSEVASLIKEQGTELTDEEIEVLLRGEDDDDNNSDVVPSVELWHECPFLHSRSAVSAAERDAILDRLVEYFALGRVEVTVPRDLFDESSDDDDQGADENDPERKRMRREKDLERAANPYVTIPAITRRGNVIIASHFSELFGAYLNLEDATAPPPAEAAGAVEGSEKPKPITGVHGPVGQSGRSFLRKWHRKSDEAKAQGRGKIRRVKIDAPEFTTGAELTLRSHKTCEYIAMAIAKLRERGIRIDGIVISDNDCRDLEPFLGSLKKHGLAPFITHLDASRNQLETLRFLFYIRAHFPAMLSLRLLDNPITRKPDYREQLRKTLPNLYRLDGETVRKPPLALPYPIPSEEVSAEHERVTRFVAALLNAFERGVVDEDFAQRHFHPSVTFSLSVHPECSFALPSWAMTAEEQAAREKMSDIERGKRKDRLKELWLITPQDRRESMLFEVGIRNASRDLRVGKEAIQKYARGPLNVQTAYASSVYPARFAADHHLHFATISSDEFPAALTKAAAQDAKRAAKQASQRGTTLFGEVAGKASSKPSKLPTAPVGALPERTVFAVRAREGNMQMLTLHGVMTWRIPSLHGNSAYKVYFDRTMTLLPNPDITPEVAQKRQRRREKRRRLLEENDADYPSLERSATVEDLLAIDDLHDVLEEYLLYNDQLSLRPVVYKATQDIHRVDPTYANDAQFLGGKQAIVATPVYNPRAVANAKRLAAIFQTTEETAARVLEQSTSDACAFSVLEEMQLSADNAENAGMHDVGEPLSPAELDAMTAMRNRLAPAPPSFTLKVDALQLTRSDDDDDDSGTHAAAAAVPSYDIEADPLFATMQAALKRSQTQPFVAPPPSLTRSASDAAAVAA